MTVSPALDARFREAAAAAGLLDVAYDLAETPIGTLIVNAGEDGGWNLAYAGVVPESRRRGLGRELVRKALVEARLAEQPFVSLAVDLRNDAARALYRQMGFEPVERRELLFMPLAHR